MPGEYHVCQFFNLPSESYEYVRRWVDKSEAIKTFLFYTTNVASKTQMVNRVIITDGGDAVVLEWVYGKGYTNDGKRHFAELLDLLNCLKNETKIRTS